MAAFSPLLDILEQVPDPRRAEGKMYELPPVLLFSILAIVSGCNSYRCIVTFIDVHRQRLNAMFGLQWRRAPAHTAIRYVLQGSIRPTWRLRSVAMPACCRRRARAPERAPIALDGKVLRGSFDRFHDRAAAGVPSAFATETALVLAHVDIDGKDSEIPAAQTLLAELGVAAGAIPSPSMPCTAKKTFRGCKIGRRRPDGPGQRQPADPARALQQGRRHDSAARLHLQPRAGPQPFEHRTGAVFHPAHVLAGTEWHSTVAAIIQVKREVFTRNAATGMLSRSAETAVYVSNTPLTAARAAQPVRAHWKVENTSHDTRDVTLGEDRSRIRTNPGVFARLRSFAFNILKAKPTGTLGQDCYPAALAGIDHLINLTGLQR